METLEQVLVSLEGGVGGDYRGAVKGKPYKRQVTLMESGDWEAALAEIGHSIPWWERRANLLVDDLDLPQIKGALLRIGSEVVLQVTGEDDPCQRMEAVAPGLMTALPPDWRGGACALVVHGGMIAVGDEIRIDI